MTYGSTATSGGAGCAGGAATTGPSTGCNQRAWTLTAAEESSAISCSAGDDHAGETEGRPSWVPVATISAMSSVPAKRPRVRETGTEGILKSSSTRTPGRQLPGIGYDRLEVYQTAAAAVKSC